MFAAGYDIRSKEGWEQTMTEFERDVGLQYLRGMHLNDSKATLGSHKDRHENIGLGHLGLNTFLHILNDPRTQDIPLIMETPAHDEGTSTGKNKKPGDGWEVWQKEVEILKLLSTPAAANGEKLDEWTAEVRALVQGKSGSKQNKARPKGKTGKGVKRKRGDASDEGESSCDAED